MASEYRKAISKSVIVPSVSSNSPSRGQSDKETAYEPKSKLSFDLLDILTVLFSFGCLILSAAVIVPELGLSWRLGLTNQLIVIGFLLGVMNLCLKYVATTTFLRIEACLGQSHLQNFDAILRNQILMSHTSVMWRATLLLSLALPLGLSVAYKRFIGGVSSHIIQSTGGSYGMAGPAGVVGSLGLLINATLPFLLAANNDSIPFGPVPQAYGFNTLLLSNTSSALLDAPIPDYLTGIQHELLAGETRVVSAAIIGTVTSYDSSVNAHRNDSGYWDWYYEEAAPWNGGTAFISLHNPSKQGIGFLVPDFGSWAFLGIVDDDLSLVEKDFEAVAMKFNTIRKQCHGTWSITLNAVKLIDGRCDDQALPGDGQDIITKSWNAYSNSYMPVFAEYLGAFGNSRNGSHWMMPTFTTILASVYWSARAEGVQSQYHVQEDQVISTIPTLRSHWLLYTVVAIQPVLTALMLVCNYLLSSKSMSRGFGLISILAGVDNQTLHTLKGASLSGKARGPVELQIVAQPLDIVDGSVEQVTYFLRWPRNIS
jgi:hypothetical protein